MVDEPTLDADHVQSVTTSGSQIAIQRRSAQNGTLLASASQEMHFRTSNRLVMLNDTISICNSFAASAGSVGILSPPPV